MKKVLVFCLMMVMVLSVSISAYAVPSGFVSSPSVNAGPTVIEFTPSNEKCTAKLVVTPYGEKHTLSEYLQKLMDSAYKTVTESKDLTKLNKDFAKAVSKKKLDAKNLAVSDLFDIHVTGCDFHEGHTEFDITLSADSLNRFVGLLHMTKEGKWEYVSNAKVTNNGEHLHFSVESFSPFAIIVDTSVPDKAPQTSNSNMIYIYGIVLLVSAPIIVVLISRRRRNNY